MKKVIYLLPCFFTLMICLNTGCKKFVQVNPSEDIIPSSQVFSNDSMARQAVTGLYIRMMSNNQFLCNGGLSVYTGLSSDELIRTNLRAEEQQFVDNSLLSNNGIIAANFWRAGYMYIYQANACLENIPGSSSLSTAVKRQLTGESKFMRALCYWYMVNLYGDIPLTSSTSADANTVLARTSAATVYQFILNDLQDAYTLLSDSLPNTFPGKWAAAALLARLHCYLKHWEQAEIFAGAVIGSGKFSIVNDLNAVFINTSPETIFQLQPVLSNNCTAEALAFIPGNSNALPIYALTADFMQSFEVGDERRNKWVKSNINNGQTYYYPYKYKKKAGPPPVTEYNVVIRLAEQYLIRAEARAQLNEWPASVEDINIIRGRAGLPPVSANSNLTECLAVIEQERRKELFTEWGHRWFDLKRANRITTVLQLLKGNNWQPTDQLYPIPSSEILKDPNLLQNPGY